MIKKPVVHLLRLGLQRYEPIWKLQMDLVKKVKNERKDNYLIFVEHLPVYTTGIRSDSYSKDEEERLKKLDADFYRYVRKPTLQASTTRSILSLKHIFGLTIFA